MKPYLVQRCCRCSEERTWASNIDKHFSFEYMGSAEFEFGALPQALRKMREDKDNYSLEPKRIKTEEGLVAWFVGNPQDLDLAKTFFEDQLQEKRSWRLKEWTSIRESYMDDKCETTIWWALDVTRPWLLFRKKEDARVWITHCFSPPT